MIMSQSLSGLSHLDQQDNLMLRSYEINSETYLSLNDPYVGKATNKRSFRPEQTHRINFMLIRPKGLLDAIDQ